MKGNISLAHFDWVVKIKEGRNRCSGPNIYIHRLPTAGYLRDPGR